MFLSDRSQDPFVSVLWLVVEIGIVVMVTCVFSSTAPEYNSALFLDCCALVRRAIQDLKADFGFDIGPWNQTYMYDTLPTTISRESNMKPGDLVFISGTYFNKKSKTVNGLIDFLWSLNVPVSALAATVASTNLCYRLFAGIKIILMGMDCHDVISFGTFSWIVTI